MDDSKIDKVAIYSQLTHIFLAVDRHCREEIIVNRVLAVFAIYSWHKGYGR